MSEKKNINSWFENGGKNSYTVFARPKSLFNHTSNVINVLNSQNKHFYKTDVYNQQNYNMNKSTAAIHKDNLYLQVDKNNSWNFRDQKPYRDDRYKYERSKPDQFYLILGKFYQRKRNVKYRDMKWEQSKAIEKQIELDFDTKLRATIEQYRQKIDSCTKDELIKMKEEVAGHIKKLSYNHKINNIIAKNITSSKCKKTMFLSEDKASSTDKFHIDDKIDITLSCPNEQSINDNDPNLFGNKDSQGELERDRLLKNYFELTQPDLLLNDFYEVYIHNCLENANMLADKNRASTKIVLDKIKYSAINDIKIPKEKKWTKNENDMFIEEIRNSDKDFARASNSLGKDVKDIVLHYYRIKKKANIFNKRRGGRISDQNIKTIVEHNWDDKSIEAFVGLYVLYGKNWENFEAEFPNKTVKDFKLLYRYLNKFEKNRLEKKSKKRIVDDDKAKIKYLTELTICERQIFAKYYPFIGRNWISMAQVCNKSVSTVQGYYRHYYKKLSPDEKRFETMMREYDRDELSCFKHRKTINDQEYSEKCGILFLAKNEPNTF